MLIVLTLAPSRFLHSTTDILLVIFESKEKDLYTKLKPSDETLKLGQNCDHGVLLDSHPHTHP
jgi:hypothetical protein